MNRLLEPEVAMLHPCCLFRPLRAIKVHRRVCHLFEGLGKEDVVAMEASWHLGKEAVRIF